MSEASGAPPAAGAAAARRPLFFFKRLLPLLALAAVAWWFFGDGPRETALAFQLEGRRAGLQTLEVDLYQHPGQVLARHLEYRFSEANPAPVLVERTLDLSPGEYRAQVLLRYEGRDERVERTFTLKRGQERVELRF